MSVSQPDEPQNLSSSVRGEVVTPQQILYQVLAQIDKEAKQRGSYYDLLTPEQQQVVDLLVSTNYSTYQASFNNDVSGFREAMARNYLTKHRVFTPLVRAAGFEPYTPSTEAVVNINKINGSEIAALTNSSSYLLVGPGSLDSAHGASFNYNHIPFREGERGIANTSVASGATLSTMPIPGGQLTVKGTGIGPITTSPLVFIFTRNCLAANANMETVNQTVSNSFNAINTQTLFRR